MCKSRKVMKFCEVKVNVQKGDISLENLLTIIDVLVSFNSHSHPLLSYEHSP